MIYNSQSLKAVSPWSSDSFLSSPPFPTMTFFRAIVRFCRPESTFGSAVMTLSVCLAVIPSNELLHVTFDVFLLVASMVLWTIAVHGINQIYDIEVDKINKPDFPLPSGQLSVGQAWFLSVGTGLAASIASLLVLPFFTGVAFILVMVLVTFVYSVPWFEARKSPWLPKFMAISTRGVLVPAISYVGACTSIGSQVGHPEHLGFILSFATLFCIGMNTFEDIPDIDGDRLSGYASIAQRLGPFVTSYICLGSFFFAYVVIVLWQVAAPHLFSLVIGISTSFLLLVLFCFRFSQLIKLVRNDVSQAKSFYRFLWQLYCIQYLLLPILFEHPSVLV